MPRKKYSYLERVKHHGEKYKNFVDRFRFTPKYGGTSLDFEKLEAAELSDPKISYSHGFSSFSDDIGRGYLRSEEDLKKKSEGYQKGYKAGKKAWDKSRNIKF